MADIITLEIGRATLDYFYEVVTDELDPNDYDDEFINVLNAIETSLGKELTELDEDEE